MKTKQGHLERELAGARELEMHTKMETGTKLDENAIGIGTNGKTV
jgi:hypothetical protein